MTYSSQALAVSPTITRCTLAASGSTSSWKRVVPVALLGALFTLAAAVAGQAGTLYRSPAPTVLGAAETQTQANLLTRVILATDSGSAIVMIDPVSGATAVLCQTGLVQRPFGIAIDRDGNLLVTDTSALAVILIDPRTGRQEIIVSGPEFGLMFGIAVGDDGFIYVANAQTILRINPTTRQVTKYPRGRFSIPLGVAVGKRGELYIADGAGAVWRLNPRNGAQHLVAKGGYLVQPCGIVSDEHGRLFVTDLASRRVVEINSRNGKQRLVTEAEHLVSPVGIALEYDDYLLIADPDSFGLMGGIIRVQISTGLQSEVARGSDALQNYRCLAMVFMPTLLK